MTERAENLEADFKSHYIEGIAVHGNTPFKAPLISHVVGNLWQGGCRDGVELPHDFKRVISLYPWEKYKTGPDTAVTEFRMYDAGYLPDMGDLEIAFKLVRHGEQNGKTLVHCQAGLNRSGLVAALVLIDKGMSPAQAIKLLRDQRSPAVLCNTYFENWLINGSVQWLEAING